MVNKILFWLDRNFIIFAITNKLQNKIDVEKYAIVDDVENQKDFYTNQSLVDFKKIWHFTDFVQANKKEPSIDYLKQFEKTYSINFWHIAYTERLFDPKINIYNKFERLQILSLFEQECKFFERVLDGIKPDYLIISTITQHHMYLLYLLCKAKGINVLTLEASHFGDRWIITSTTDRPIDPKLYENFTSYSKRSFEELRNYLKKYTPLMYAYTDMTRYQTSKLTKFKAVSKFLISTKETEKHFAVFGKTKSSVFFKGTARAQLLKKKKREKFIDKNFIRKIDPNDQIIYFSLTYEPEKSILIGAPYYTNQIALITNVAKSIPVEYVLYVKEHPGMKEQGWREISYYKQILNLPNVKLIHPSVSQDELVKNCSLAITIKGTVGLEAAFYGKPAICFSFDSGYSELPSVCTITKFEDLPEAIRGSLKNRVKLSDVNKYVDYMNEISFDYDNTNFSSEFSKKFNFQVGFLNKIKIEPDEMSSFLLEYDEMFDLVADKFYQKIQGM